jgi:hypothetical protein
MRYDLGFFDHETCRIESAANPFAAKLLAHVSGIDLFLLARPERFELPTSWFVGSAGLVLARRAAGRLWQFQYFAARLARLVLVGTARSGSKLVADYGASGASAGTVASCSWMSALKSACS